MAAEESLIQKQEEALDENLRELVEAGLFYGRKKSKTHPRMKQAILGNRNGIEIINLTKTRESLETTLEFIRTKAKEGSSLFFVGTQPPAEGIVALAKEFGYPYVSRRWLGGTLTNSKVILGRIEYYKKLKSDVQSGALEKYTKKERLGMEKELARLDELMGGLETYTGRPGALIIIDPNLHMTAVREARTIGAPIVALINTDCDPDLINYPVPGNNKSVTSVNWFLDKVKEAIKEGKAAAPKAEAPAEEKKKDKE